MPIGLIIQGLAIAIIAVIYFRGARVNDKNGILWAVIGIGIFVLSVMLITIPVFAYAGPPSPTMTNIIVLLFILETGLPFALALFARIKLLPARPASSISSDILIAEESQPAQSSSGSSRFLYFIPAIFSALWVFNQFNLELLRTFVGRNFGPYRNFVHYMETMGNIYDAMDVVAVGAWVILLAYLGYKYFRERPGGESDRKLKILILVFVCFLVQSFIVLA